MPDKMISRLGISLGATIVLVAAGIDVYHLLSGSQTTPLSSRRNLVLLAFSVGSALAFLATLLLTFTPSVAARLVKFRQRMGWLRWILIVPVIALPTGLLQFTSLGEFFDGHFFRLLVLLVVGLLSAALLTSSPDGIFNTSGLSLGFLLTGVAFVIATTFAGVSTYPFSLYWSEGNRMWDYSILFGRQLYNFPADQPIFAYIDLGRQALWGLPFLLPDVPILVVRAWSALLFSLPYALLGLVGLRRIPGQSRLWWLAGASTLVFLSNGPIYTPLVLSAILIALAWRRSLWLAIPMVLTASYYAQATRFTWMFAPAAWATMLYLVDQKPERISLRSHYWRSAIAVGIAGLAGGYLLPQWFNLESLLTLPGSAAPSVVSDATIGGPQLVSLEGLASVVSRQELLWQRLLPNPTFGLGILLALALATAPLILLLVGMVRTRRWQLDGFRKIALLAPLLAFLIVGLVVSVKIGGGSNLHNLDMFLISLFFATALAWRVMGSTNLVQLEFQPAWFKTLVVVMLACLAYQPVLNADPFYRASAQDARQALGTIQAEVEKAQSQGEVLFLDQRQLLTFGHFPVLPLVDDYEKKYLMDQAMSEDAEYFADFYEDLSNKRFSLIVSEPIKVQLQGSAQDFGEENDLWVKWVSKPLLCYYEPALTLKSVRVQLLVPRQSQQDCPLPTAGVEGP